MKYSSWFAVLIAACMLLPLSAFARQKAKDAGNFTLFDPAQVGRTQLAPGQYKAEWNGTGNNVEVSILKNRQVVATTPAKIVQSTSQDAVVVNDQTKKLEQIDFGKMKESLVLEPPTQ